MPAGPPKDNENRLIHGGSAARTALSENREFTGPAALAERSVKTELAHSGRLSIVERGAIRLQAVADLYFNALIDAGERGDEKKLTSYAKTFGWIQSKALSAWAQLKQEQAEAPNALDYENILAQEDDN